jgi:hypothetical protein
MNAAMVRHARPFIESRAVIEPYRRLYRYTPSGLN